MYSVDVYDANRLRQRWPAWGSLSDYGRLQRLRNGTVDPRYTQTTTNQILVTYLQNLTDYVDPNNSATNISASHLAVGTADTEPVPSNTALGSEVFRTSVGSTTDNGQDLATTTLIGANSANGNTLREAGLVDDATNTFINRTLINPVEKTSDIEVTINASIFHQAL
ncbi:hypothetical protein HZS55_09095 [Halosimplex rubrum]|uniref:Uncharacterized protein n=1 Tax=Halosimplex rubrum TaxID=869889 RepID=A0A7D5P978_9EURY|nr:hypothetical protein [Halosimplex rubrum]QLH77440.1 hypothetical protein HZS55_09095 [Halosimplex rubrum]